MCVRARNCAFAAAAAFAVAIALTARLPLGRRCCCCCARARVQVRSGKAFKSGADGVMLGPGRMGGKLRRTVDEDDDDLFGEGGGEDGDEGPYDLDGPQAAAKKGGWVWAGGGVTLWV